MIYAIKKKNESNERLMSRFKKIVQRSRVVPFNKRNRYHANDLTKTQVRTAAVMRSKHRVRRAREQYYS